MSDIVLSNDVISALFWFSSKETFGSVRFLLEDFKNLCFRICLLPHEQFRLCRSFSTFLFCLISGFIFNLCRKNGTSLSPRYIFVQSLQRLFVSKVFENLKDFILSNLSFFITLFFLLSVIFSDFYSGLPIIVVADCHGSFFCIISVLPQSFTESLTFSYFSLKNIYLLLFFCTLGLTITFFFLFSELQKFNAKRIAMK